MSIEKLLEQLIHNCGLLVRTPSSFLKFFVRMFSWILQFFPSSMKTGIINIYDSITLEGFFNIIIIQ